MNKKISKILVAIVLLLLFLVESQSVLSQYSISNPYSKYGLGFEQTSINQTSASMGGVGYAFARNNEVNILNPASYSAIEKQSFVFSMGFDFSWKTLSNNNNSSDAFFGSISNISLAFPILDRLKAGLSLMPLTDINYNASDTVLSFVNHVKTYQGNGGVNKFTFGLSYDILKTAKTNLSIGANATYYFGNIYRATSIDFLTQADSNGKYYDTIGFLDNTTETNYNVSSFGFDFGLLYRQKLNNEDVISLGVAFTPSVRLRADRTQIFYTYYSYAAQKYLQDTLSYTKDKTKIKVPMKIGCGLSYEKPDKIFVEADFTFTKWSDFDMDLQSNAEMKDNLTFNMGAEYIPNIFSTLYYNKMAYRLGFHYDNGYIFLQDNRITEFGISFGVALPIKKLGTKVNLGAEYGKRGTTNNNLIRENYFRIGLSFSAKDRWFVKRKYQ